MAVQSITFPMKQRVGLAAPHNSSFTMQSKAKTPAHSPMPSPKPHCPMFQLQLRVFQSRLFSYNPPISQLTSLSAVIFRFITSSACFASICFSSLEVSLVYLVSLVFSTSCITSTSFSFNTSPLPPPLNLNGVAKLNAFSAVYDEWKLIFTNFGVKCDGNDIVWVQVILFKALLSWVELVVIVCKLLSLFRRSITKKSFYFIEQFLTDHYFIQRK